MKHGASALLVLAGFALMTLSCQRQDVNPNIISCPDFPAFDCDFGPLFKSLSPQSLYPCFNPLNGDEFVFVTNRAIWKHTLSTGETQLIMDGLRPLTQLSWGTSGWITFAQIDWNIWLLRDDGSELRQISNTPRDLYPEFSPDGQHVLYPRNMEYSFGELEDNPTLNEQYLMIVTDLQGTAVDSFCRLYSNGTCFPWKTSSWSFDDRLAAEFQPDENRYGLAIYDFEGNVTDIVYETGAVTDGRMYIRDIEWHPSKNGLYFTDGWALRSVDLDNGRAQLLQAACDTRVILDISISPDGEKILASEQISVYKGCEITQQIRLVIMDSDGSNKKVLDLP